MKEFKRSVGGSFFKEKNADKVSDITLLEDMKARVSDEYKKLYKQEIVDE